MLFSNQRQHEVTLKGDDLTVKDLIDWLCTSGIMKDPRKELFIMDGTVRPGILVLINDADWELEDEIQYRLQDGDRIGFVSTLHGG